MGDLPGIVQTVFGIVAMIAAGAAAVLTVRQQTLRQSVEDRDKRIDGLEGRLDDAERERDAEREKRERIERDLEAVSQVVTGEAHWVALEGRTEDIFNLVNSIAATLDKVADTVRRILTKVGGR